MLDSADDPCDDLTTTSNLSGWTKIKRGKPPKPLKTNKTKMRLNRN